MSIWPLNKWSETAHADLVTPMETSSSISNSAVVAASAAPTLRHQLGVKIEAIGEWLNPLLVKEVRQSLKSRQFSITFTAVLCLSWLWSIARIAQLGPEVSFGAYGPELFFGYYLILAVPLILIVPYSAFRSLISEREDNTYELVAITALRPRQIISGKLGSAMAQMAVYYSAVAPCLAFTYLLRGIDIPTICWILFYTFLASLGFSLCTLLLATLAKEKHWQVLLAVLSIVGLFVALVLMVLWCHDRLRYSRLPFTSSEFWIENLILLSFYATTFVLLYLAAAAQLTFTAENRSTSLRCAMFSQQILFVGWMGYGISEMLAHNRGEAAEVGFMGVVATLVACIYWFIMGGFMAGEASELSLRVKRHLHKSDLSRALFTWFNPGPGTGFIFAVSNASAIVILALIAVWYGYANGNSTTSRIGSAPQLIAQIFLLLGYFVIFLGTANLLLRLLRKITHVTLSAGILVSVVLVMAGWGIPAIIDPYDIRHSTYNVGHITDPYWSCIATIDQLSMVHSELLVIILPTAALVFLFNLVYIVPETWQRRILPPQRVIDEDQALTATPQPEPQPSNPWE